MLNKRDVGCRAREKCCTNQSHNFEHHSLLHGLTRDFSAGSRTGRYRRRPAGMNVQAANDDAGRRPAQRQVSRHRILRHDNRRCHDAAGATKLHIGWSARDPTAIPTRTRAARKEVESHQKARGLDSEPRAKMKNPNPHSHNAAVNDRVNRAGTERLVEARGGSFAAATPSAVGSVAELEIAAR